MSALDLTTADVWATGITPDRHPVEFLRHHLDHLGALPTAAVTDVPDGTRILVGGAVTHRQRPATAGGITFLYRTTDSSISGCTHECLNTTCRRPRPATRPG
jgi:error-prone DNA polymerase